MFKKNYQQIFAVFLLIILLLSPASGIFPVNQAKAVSEGERRRVLNGAGTAVAAYYVLRCSFVGRVSGAADLLGDLEDKILDFFKGIGKSLAQKAQDAIDPSKLLSSSVPVAVTEFSGSAQANITTIESSTADAVRNDLCSTMDRAISQVIKQQIINQLVNDVMAWIKNGYKGKVIVHDWKQLLSNAGNAAVGEFANSVGAGFLCSPFNFQVQFLLKEQPDFETKAGCTLDDIVGNINNFYTDFRSGGWIAYQESWSPRNNFYGATLAAINEADRLDEEAKKAAQNEGVAGQGYLSQRNNNNQITAPGSLVSNAAAEVLVRTPLGSILTATELSGYVEAILTTAINEFTKGQIDRLRQGF